MYLPSIKYINLTKPVQTIMPLCRQRFNIIMIIKFIFGQFLIDLNNNEWLGISIISKINSIKCSRISWFATVIDTWGFMGHTV